MAGDDAGPTTDDQPTVLERPGRADPSAAETERDLRREPPGPPSRALAPGSGITTLETMRAEELEATRSIIRIGRVLGLAALLPLPLLGGSVFLRVLFAALVVAAVAVGFAVDRRLDDPDRYGETTIMVLAIIAGLAAYTGLLYWGIFSAAQLFPVLGLYYYARRVAFGPALGVYLASVVFQAVAAALVISGVVADPGVFAPELEASTLTLGHVLIQLGNLCAFVFGRHTYRAARAAIERMHRAMRLAAQREALLIEARQDLRRALRVGEPGRYTDQVFGSYRLGAVLGHGGMGEVYEGEHVETGEPAAVKLLPVSRLADTHQLSRFLRELDIVSSLRSAHVVRVLETSEPDDPIPFLVMERLRGDSLAALFRVNAVDLDGLDAFVAQVGEALDAAREAGIVHRDLKPHNLVLTDEGWKVLDFGVATLSASSGTLTAGRVVGTPHYMSPEQARGEPVDHRADLYSLAAIIYRWLTGRPPHTGADQIALLYQVVHVMPARPSRIADLPEAVDEVMAIAMAKDPADRFATPGQLRSALARALDGQLSPELRGRAQ